MIVEAIIVIITYVIVSNIIKRVYDKCDSFVERIGLILYVLIIGVPIVIYLLDRWNITDVFGFMKNIEGDMWFEYISNYTSSVIGAILSSVISICLVFYQIDKNNKDTENRDKENLRIQNLPILKYSFDNKTDVGTEIDDFAFFTGGRNHSYLGTFIIKNIGLNNIKNIKVDMIIDEYDVNKRVIGNNTLEVLEKGDEIKIAKRFLFNSDNKTHKVKYVIYYQDLLSNWYTQKVNIDVVTTDCCDSGIYQSSFNVSVDKEMIGNFEE